MPDWVVDWLSDPLTDWLTDLHDLCDWLTCNGGADSTPDWMVDWASDSLTALFAVDVTDLVEDWCKAWLSGLLS